MVSIPAASIGQAMKNGTAVTEEMARAMNMDIGSQFQLLRQQVVNLAEILGRTLLPVVLPIIQGLSGVVLFFQKLARSMPGLTRVVLTLSLALGAVLVVVGGVIAAAGTIGLMLPAISAGLAAMGAAAAGVGSLVAAYFLPVVAVIAGVVLAVYLLKRAWESNFAGIRDTILGATVAASSERMTKNLDRIQKGTMMIGAGLALMALPVGLVASTAATQKALGEMASLGTKDLRALEDAAESFTNTWAGYSKAEFIGAAYDVKSALAGLSDEAVGTFSSMAALTAKATKASIQEMVGTFTTGYGIFKPIMGDMTDMEWAKVFSGAMSQTVAAFKTTGAQMAETIKNIGAVAASSNVLLQDVFYIQKMILLDNISYFCVL